MSDVASLSVALHLNSAAFKSQITDAYQKAGQASKKFNDQATAQANELSEAIARTVSAAKNIGMQGNESGQFSGVTRGAGQLNFVLHEVAAGSNVASSTIINALIPAVHSLKNQLDGSAGGWKTQQDAARNAAAELAAAAQSQIAAAQAEKQAALSKAAIAEKTIAAAQAQREEAIALDEYYAKQTQMNKLYGLNVSYQEQHLKNERAIIEANRLEAGALEKLKTVKATVMAADLAEAEGKAALVASTEAAAAANTQMTISQRIAATSSRALSSAMSLLGGPVGIGLSVLAAGGTLIYSEFKKAEEQTKKLNAAILDLHTSSLVSLTDLKNLNNQLGDTDASIDAVTATAKAGFSGHLLTDVATLANAYAEAGGSAQDLVNNLSSLRGDPIAAMEKLTSQGVALNDSIIQQVISLTKKGQTAQATQVIMEQALEAENVRLKELGAQADTYLDKLKSLGREWGALGGLSEAVAWGDVLGKNQKDFEDKTRQFLAASKAGYAEAQSERIKNAAGLKSYMDAGTSAAEKRAAAIKQLNNSIYQPDSTDYQRILKGINDEYEKVTKKPKGSASTGVTEGQRALEQAQQRNAVLLEQAQTTDKQTESQRQLIIFEQKISSLKGEHLTADQQSLVNMQAQIRSQLQSNVQLEKETALRQTAMKYQQESIKWAEEADAMQREAALAVDKFGMSEREAADAEARNAIINRFNQRRIALEKDFTDHTSAEYQARLADLENAQQRELQITEKTRQQKMAAEQDFSAGLRKGAVDWLDSASSYATQSANLVSNTMSGFVDQLSGALSGNKTSWMDWSKSVLQAMQKVILNAMLVNSIQSMGGSSLFGLFNGGSGGAGGPASGGTFGAGVWDAAASGVKYNAKGGIYDSPSLSSYGNGIFNTPQVFEFAKGAGVFAEAGPEAIMPLARGANGSLGVRAVDGGSQDSSGQSSGDTVIQQTINQYINISGNGDAALARATEEAADRGARNGAKMARQEMLQDFQNRGQGRRLLGV